jgi:hypothetical protein
VVERGGLLPTPVAGDGRHGSPAQKQTSGAPMLTGAIMQLLPTPTATDAKSSGGAAYPDCSHGTTLTDAARAVAAGSADVLLPTPVSSMVSRYPNGSPTLLGMMEITDEEDLEDAARRALRGVSRKTDDMRLLPTPKARDHKGADRNPRGGDLWDAIETAAAETPPC